MKKILIVEDDTSLQKVLQQRLKQEDIEAFGVTTVQAAIDFTTKNKPDLILLDIMLPGGTNGFDFLEEVKRNPELKTIPVILLTNLDTERKTALDIGAVDYLIKPNLSLDQIVEKVKSHL